MGQWLSAPATRISGKKRAADETDAAEAVPAQRRRLSNSAAAARPPLSTAERCAADALTIVFGFIELQELVSAARICAVWYSAAAKEKPRGLSWSFWRDEPLDSLCAGSPLKRHISRVDYHRYYSTTLSLSQLAQLRHLPELTALSVQLSAAGLSRLMDEQGDGALAALKAAFPPKLRELTLVLSKAYSTEARQLLLDALPAMKELEKLTMAKEMLEQPPDPARLSLEPLLRLPRLSHLTLDTAGLTKPQLRVVKQIATLQVFNVCEMKWTADELAAFCRPGFLRPWHRLQRLQEFVLRNTPVNDAAMAELVRLPALTALEPDSLTLGAMAFLPRLPLLRRLSVAPQRGSWYDADLREARRATLLSALPACPALTDLTLAGGDCAESFGDQLVEAVPRLRSLSFHSCSLSSLRFLRRASNLKELSLISCTRVRSGHVFCLSSFAPQLECLRVEHCAGLLDEAERRLLTPPGALGLPHLRQFTYIR